MDLKLSLTAKVVILCIVPLLFQFGLLYSLESLRSQSEADVDRAIRAREISAAINQLAQHIFEVESMYGSETGLLEAAPTEREFKIQLDRLHKDYDNLKMLVRDDPARMEIVRRSEKTAEEAMRLFIPLRMSQIKGGENSWKDREPLWQGLRRCATSIMSNEMIQMGETERAQAERSPEVQREFRGRIRQLVFAGAAINLLLAAILAIFLTRGIMRRLKRINENSYRLASNLPLNPEIGGTDEIASLDATFHTMASALKESMRKERVVLENTQDCICTIDEDGTITSTNPACATMFNFDDSELLGRRVIELIEDGEMETAHTYMLRLQAGEGSKNLEVTMKRHEGTTFDALWSAQWSPEEKSIFCVIRDQSERIQAERIKQEVVAMVTHDLRTPLTVVQNFLQFLDDGLYGSVTERGEKFLVGSRLSCNRMLELINDLLDAEKIKSGMMTIEPVETDLAEIIDQSLKLLSPIAEELGVKLVCAAKETVVKADTELIARTVTNLISNALKFSPRDGTVVIKLGQRDRLAYVSVQDSGPGIPKDQLETVFERFHQVSSQLAKLKGGSGLGLTICKSIVQMHGGKIWVESEEGKGSTFVFCLPT